MSKIRNYPYEVQERAAIYEFEAGMTREEAEDKAIEDYDGREDISDADEEKE